MIAGHYATALVPYELTRKTSRAPFWIFLIAAQFLDLAMLVMVQLGVEKLSPQKFMDMAFSTSSSDMHVTHDILPVLGWALVVGALFLAITRRPLVALWCATLVLVHEACDLLVGFGHHLSGDGTPSLGLDLYNRAPTLGLLIEAALCIVIVTWFCWHRARQGRPVTTGLKWGLYVILVGGALATLPLATHSLNAWLGS